ncbi:YraN family protein [bacterium]|nr:YraN family protein [bacterium]
MATNTYRQRLGAWGELQAETHLLERGFELIQRNYRTRFGEIDLVMKQADLLVFVEVKTRSNNRFGPPEQSVTPEKQEHLLLAAEQYVEEHPELPADWRVDVVAVIGKPGAAPLEIIWFENALA